MNALTGCCALVALLALSPPASAQEAGLDAHGFQMTAQDGDPRDGLSLNRPGHMSAGEWYANFLFEYAKSPLKVTYEYPFGRPDQTFNMLDNVTAFNLGGGYTPIDMLRVDLAMPVYFNSTTTIDGETWSQGAAVGDLRLAGMVAFIQPDPASGGLGLGLAPWISLPTGDEAHWLGNTKVSGGAALAVTYETGSLTVGADLGAQLNPEVMEGNLNGTDQLIAGLGFGYLFSERAGFTTELRYKPGLSPYEPPPDDELYSASKGTASPLEVRAAVRGRSDGGVHYLGGVAAGLNQGVGAAMFRVFIGGGFGKIEAGPTDIDGDGILDADDACPEQAEVVNDYKDDDGCPDELAQVSLQVTKDGSPASGVPISVTGPSGDQSLESKSAGLSLELIPGDYSFEATLPDYEGGEESLNVGEGKGSVTLALQFIPPGRIDVTVIDEESQPINGAQVIFVGDRAPQDPLVLAETNQASQELRPGKYSILVKATDYAVARADLQIDSGQVYAVDAVMKEAKVMVEKENIQILEKVFFETDKAIIKSNSFELLDEVASTILANPHVKRIEIAGHTDNQGGTDYNVQLSNDRASAVKTYLVDKGVAATKLDATGYGESKPIATNDTPAGRAKNRRVEFIILEQDTE